MEIDPKTAAAVGFPKTRYAIVERERRWLCREIPMDRVVSGERITDLYVTGTQLRLREAVPLDGRPAARRLGKKGDVSPAVRLLTSIYLSEKEHDLLAAMPGQTLRKVVYKLTPEHGVSMSIDRFEGALEGLIMAEVEFDDMESLRAFPGPAFAEREVTDDPRYNGGTLAHEGLPDPR